jgi:proline iminopeptidase
MESVSTRYSENPKMKAHVNGTNIFFEVEGTSLAVAPDSLVEKPVCAVLHGGPAADHSYFRPHLSPLSEQMQLIYVDHRGTGRSDHVPVETCTIENMADDVEELRKHLGIGKWIVMGNSFGGMWALTYAVRYPGSLSKLILIDTAPSYGFWLDAQQMAEKKATPQQKAIYKNLFEGRVDTEKEFTAWFDTMMPLYYYNYKEEFGKQFVSRMKGSFEVARYMWKNVMPKYDLRARLGNISVPTLILEGRHDWVTPVSQSELLRKGIPNSKMVIFEKSGHLPFVEEPALFLRTVSDFVNS